MWNQALEGLDKYTRTGLSFRQSHLEKLMLYMYPGGERSQDVGSCAPILVMRDLLTLGPDALQSNCLIPQPRSLELRLSLLKVLGAFDDLPAVPRQTRVALLPVEAILGPNS